MKVVLALNNNIFCYQGIVKLTTRAKKIKTSSATDR